MLKVTYFIFVMIFCLLPLRVAHGQEFWSLLRDVDGDAVEIKADFLEAVEGRGEVRARGHVQLRWQEFRLLAETVIFRPEDSVAVAEGNVVLEDAVGNLLECSRLEVNTLTQKGEVENGSLWVAEEGYRIWGKHFRKTGAHSYTVQDGGFTTCDGTWPSWRVEAREIKVELEGYLTARSATFWVQGVPVLYTPYVWFPVKLKRQSGFLMPKVGYTSVDGFYGAARYYWVIADNVDATFELQYRSRRGWTESAEVRYALSETHRGKIGGRYLNDRLVGEQRYNIQVDHMGRFENAARARVNVDYVSDNQVFQDLGDTLDQRSVEYTRSYAFGTYDAGIGSLFAAGQYLQSLTGGGPQDEVLQTLPSAGLWGRETPLVGPLVWNPTVRATRFWRGTGDRGGRFEIIPVIGASASLGGLGVATRVGYRQNLYTIDDNTVARGGGEAQLDLNLSLARPFGSYLHALEPHLSLSWTEEGRGGTVPQYDTLDVFEQHTVVGLVLENRLLADASLRDVLRLDLEAAYELGEGQWLPVRGVAAWYPDHRSSVEGDMDVDPTLDDPLLRWSVRGRAQDGRGDRFFAGYSYLKQEASYFDGGVEIPFRRFLNLQYRNRYDARNAQTLEESVGLQLRHPCWAVQMTYSRNWREGEENYERRYYIQLELTGLGKLGTLKGVVPK